MNNSEISSNKAFQVLTYLNASERKKLIQYLESPYFGHRSIFTTMCAYMVQLIDRGADGFDKQQLWQVLFPNKPFNDVNFRKYCSDLLTIVEAFMAQEAFLHNKKRESVYLLDFVAQRRVEPLFISAVRDAKKQVQHNKYKTLDDYFILYEIERKYYDLMNFDKTQNIKPNIEEISYNLDIFYLIQKIKLCSTALSHKKNQAAEYNINFEKDIVHLLEDFDVNLSLELSIYYHAYKTLMDQDDDSYGKFKNLLSQNASLLPQHDAIELFGSALNFCARKANQGNPEFLEEYFSLFELGIRTGVFIVDGELDPWRYNNFVGTALRLGKIDWIEQFVLGSKHLLPKVSGENIFKFNLARIYRYQRKFSEVLSVLQDVEYDDINYSLISKAMLTITYYELDEYDSLTSHLAAFQVFLRRNKNISPQNRVGYLNLIKFVRQLIRLVPGDKTALSALREELQAKRQQTVNYEWLMEKVAEMESA